MNRTFWNLLVALALPLGVLGCASQEPATSEMSHESGDDSAEETVSLTADEAVMLHDDETHVTLYVTKDGFVPATVHVPAGKPVRLVVTRKTEKTCATELVMASQDIHQKLPLNEAVEISFTPETPGELRYACGMDMISGTIIVD